MPYDVLHILDSGELAGCAIVRQVAAVVAGLDPLRYRMHAWFLAGGGPLVEELQSAGAKVRIFDWQKGIRDPFAAWRFWSALRQHKFEIVHQHFGGRSVRWAIRAASDATVIAQLWGRLLEANPNRSTVPFMIRGADSVIALSHAVAKTAVGAQPRVIYPGIKAADEPKVLALAVDKPAQVIGTSTRLVPIKGVTYLVQAMALLVKEFPDLRLEIAGEGPERRGLEKQVEQLGLLNNVTFLGWQTSTEKVMANWDVYVQPSLEEGFGVAPVEAMTVGLPVVAAAVGGLPEVVQDGVTGWLVAPGDSISLAARVRELLSNPQQRRMMGAAGQARARSCFSVERMIREVSEVYEDVIDTRRKQHARSLNME